MLSMRTTYSLLIHIDTQKRAVPLHVTIYTTHFFSSLPLRNFTLTPSGVIPNTASTGKTLQTTMPTTLRNEPETKHYLFGLKVVLPGVCTCVDPLWPYSRVKIAGALRVAKLAKYIQTRSEHSQPSSLHLASSFLCLID